MSSRPIYKSVVLAWLCVMMLVIPTVMADEATTKSFMVYTDKGEYLVGEVARIYVKAEAIEPDHEITVTKIIVYDPNNKTVAEWDNLSIVLTDTETSVYVNYIVTEMEGTYTVYAEATGCPWILFFIWLFRCWSRWKYNKVIPEVPFGTVIILITLLGATGLYIQKRRRLKD